MHVPASRVFLRVCAQTHALGLHGARAGARGPQVANLQSHVRAHRAGGHGALRAALARGPERGLSTRSLGNRLWGRTDLFLVQPGRVCFQARWAQEWSHGAGLRIEDCRLRSLQSAELSPLCFARPGCACASSCVSMKNKELRGEEIRHSWIDQPVMKISAQHYGDAGPVVAVAEEPSVSAAQGPPKAALHLF